jgi:hypothetical protein
MEVNNGSGMGMGMPMAKEKPPVATRFFKEVEKSSLLMLTRDTGLVLGQSRGKSWLFTAEGKSFSSLRETPLFPEICMFSVDPREFPVIARTIDELYYVAPALVGQGA